MRFRVYLKKLFLSKNQNERNISINVGGDKMFVVKSEDWFIKFDKWNERVDTIDEATQFKTKKIAEHVAKELKRSNWAEVSVEEIK